MNKLSTLLFLPLSISITSAFCNNQTDTAYINRNGIIHARINSVADSIAIEIYANKIWIIDTITTLNEFRYKPQYMTGLNMVRLREVNTNYIYKDTLSYRNGFSSGYAPKRCVNTFKLPKKYEYKLMDSKGTILKTGVSDNIDVHDLKMGIYYLEYDNRTERFFKKVK